MTGPVAAQDGARLHLQHGPIDLIIEAFGEPEAVGAAYRRARDRFQSVLEELVAELPALRSPLQKGRRRPTGLVATRMVGAVQRFPESFITPMAAVAGAVADEICEVAAAEGIERLYVNNGGDIALYLAPGRRFDIGLVPDPHVATLAGKTVVSASDPVRGIATSGRHGRSLSMGIADSVTVLAENAALADAAATLVANAVDLPGHGEIQRLPACDLDTDTDLGRRPVVVGVGPLSDLEVELALDSGAIVARQMRDSGSLVAAVLCLNNQIVTVGSPGGPVAEKQLTAGVAT